MAGAATACWMATIPLRVATSGVSARTAVSDPFGTTAQVLLGSGHDLLFFAALTGAGALFLIRPLRAVLAPRWTARIHLALAVAAVVGSLLNIGVVRILGRPFNFQWFYYSDFLRSAEARSSITANLSWWSVSGGIAFCALVGWLAHRAGRWTEARARGSARTRRRMLIVAGFLAFYATASPVWIATSGQDAHRYSNPVASFLLSTLQVMHAPRLFTMPTRHAGEDFAPPQPQVRAPGAPINPDVPPPTHVILFVAETLGTRYTDLPGGNGYGVTPHLRAAAERAVCFPNIYAHAPVTNKTLVAALCGVYPRISYRFTTEEHPAIDLPNLPALLRERGYRTGFFNGAPLEFQGARNFLEAGGKFDRIEDCRDHAAAGVQFTSEWEAIGGSSDRVTVDSAITWMEEDAVHPTFAVIWTIQPHYPYFVEGEPRTVVEDPYFNRYLNAVEQSDRAFGRLMAWLEESGRSESTLVVVVGDHGEAFNQHQNSGHGGQIYEENVQVPLLVIHPRLFRADTSLDVGGMCDIAPTITDLLGLPAPAAWDGRSLFAAGRSGRVYLFAPWSDSLFGCRLGDTKVIYNATRDAFEVYDLARDPGETINLADQSEEIIEEAVERMAAWVQHVERGYQRAIGGN